MKRYALGILLSAMVVLSGTVGAFALNGSGFIDEDGDGVCDNCGTAGRGFRRGSRL